jgi:large subunit ribosomal protein L15
MSAGVPDFVVVNLDDLEKHFAAGEEVTLATIKDKVKAITGKEARLPLKASGSNRR